MIDDPDLVQHLEAAAVPMGSVLTTSGQPRSPKFRVWAIRDPLDLPPCSVFK